MLNIILAFLMVHKVKQCLSILLNQYLQAYKGVLHLTNRWNEKFSNKFFWSIFFKIW